MGALRDNMISFDKFCLKAKKMIFGYENVDPMHLINIYDQMVEKAEQADIMARELLLAMKVDEEKIDSFEEDAFDKMTPDMLDRIEKGTLKFIERGFENKTLKKDGYCLKEKLQGLAVQLRSDENMLGFITEVVEDSTRFVMVDFGEADGAVKTDIEELIY